MVELLPMTARNHANNCESWNEVLQCKHSS